MRIEWITAEATKVARPRIPRSFKAVNGLRGPGALAIAFAHLAVATDLLAYNHLEPALVVVDMFFVFSGIVIAQAYAEKLMRPAAFPEYFVRRFGRIWPLQVATLLVLLAYELIKLIGAKVFGVHFSAQPFSPDGVNLIEAIPTNLLMIHSLGVHDRETWNFPSWSLSVEFATYALFALFCLVRPSLRHLLSVLTILASLAVLIFVAPYHMRSTFDYGIFRCVAGFLAGTLCQEIATRWEAPRYPFPTLVEVIALGFFVGWLILSAETAWVYAAPLVISLFLMVFIGERGRISRLLSVKPLQFLAELSFSIYMVHAILLIVLLAGLHEYAHLTNQSLFFDIANPLADRPGAPPVVQVFRTASIASKWVIGAFYFIGVLVAAYAAYRWIEVPARIGFGRLAKRLDPSVQRPTAMGASSAKPLNPAS